jgi:hypothetical protein
MKHVFAIIVFAALFPGNNAFAPSRCTNLIQLPAPKVSSVSFRTPTTTHTSNTASPATLFARRRILSEDDLASPPDQKIIETVESLGRNDVLASGAY